MEASENISFSFKKVKVLIIMSLSLPISHYHNDVDNRGNLKRGKGECIKSVNWDERRDSHPKINNPLECENEPTCPLHLTVSTTVYILGCFK